MAADKSIEEAFSHNETTGLVRKTLLNLDSVTPGDENVDYKHLYYFLFNGITDIVSAANRKSSHPDIVSALEKLQCDSEDLFVAQEEKKDKVIPAAKSRP